MKSTALQCMQCPSYFSECRDIASYINRTIYHSCQESLRKHNLLVITVESNAPDSRDGLGIRFTAGRQKLCTARPDIRYLPGHHLQYPDFGAYPHYLPLVLVLY